MYTIWYGTVFLRFRYGMVCSGSGVGYGISATILGRIGPAMSTPMSQTELKIKIKPQNAKSNSMEYIKLP
jgi:hypothetical protein